MLQLLVVVITLSSSLRLGLGCFSFLQCILAVVTTGHNWQVVTTAMMYCR